MKSNIRLSISRDGAELINGQHVEAKSESDLVRTSAEEKVRQAVDAVAVGLGDVAGIVFDVFETFTSEAASRKLNEHGKMTVSFGITGGANTSLKFVGAKADAFMTIQLEIAALNNSSGV